MFSDKLKDYDKPCGWLKFLLNVFIPLIVLGRVWTTVTMIAAWDNFYSVNLVFNIVTIVVLIVSDLLARFLDKTAFIALIGSHSWLIAVTIISTITGFLTAQPATQMTPSVSAGVPSADAMVDGAIGTATGIVSFATLFATAIVVIIYICSLIYVTKRKDLFLSVQSAVVEDKKTVSEDYQKKVDVLAQAIADEVLNPQTSEKNTYTFPETDSKGRPALKPLMNVKLSGVTKDWNGINPQEVLELTSPGDEICFELLDLAEIDTHAILVTTKSGEPLGWIPKNFSYKEDIAQRLIDGTTVLGIVSNVIGGINGKSYGCLIHIVRYQK